jgi:hypothetical protein
MNPPPHNIHVAHNTNIQLYYLLAGAFWMEFSDWVAQFSLLFVCRMPKSIDPNSPWHNVLAPATQLEQTWKDCCGGHAGSATVHITPQYEMKVSQYTKVCIMLEQNETRGTPRSADAISVEVYQSNGALMTRNSVHGMRKICANPEGYRGRREVSVEHSFSAGTYTVLCATYFAKGQGSGEWQMNHEQPFRVRVWADNASGVTFKRLNPVPGSKPQASSQNNSSFAAFNTTTSTTTTAAKSEQKTQGAFW